MSVIEKLCLGLVLVVSGCGKTVNQCTSDSDCTSVVYPFCDVNGEYPASGGEHNVCTIVPPDCPVERCGCQPGAVTCTNNTLTTCSSDGKSVTTDSCALGCDTADNRCYTFKPTNGLDGPLTASAPEPAVVLPTSVAIDTTACMIRDSSTNAPVDVKSLLVSQLNAPPICAFYASSFDITNAAVTGANVLAFAAVGEITISGMIDEAAKTRIQGNLNAGPGSMSTGDCVGTQPTGSTSSGGGGGGNATAGGDGYNVASVPFPSAGGLAQQNFTPIFGGCAGELTSGGGGGAMQLDSQSGIHLSLSALLALGGQGGAGGGGGGAGGTLVFEAPVVEIDGGIAANGGGGGANGACTDSGGAATNDGVPAVGGVCNGAIGGAGGTGTTVADQGHNSFSGAGGGGSVGRILIRTADGTFTGPGTLFSIVKTTDTLVKH